MLINDLIAFLEDLPQNLAAAWAAWLLFGLLLSVWQRRESRRLVVHGAAPHQKSAVRPPSTVRVPTRFGKSAPGSSADAFGELEKLLEPQPGTHRLPGESPTLADTEPAAPGLPGPKSLP